MADLSWMERGACRGMDPALWFPERGDRVMVSKQVCAGCPVLLVCREFAMARRELFGVWGGWSELDRRRERRVRRLREAS